MAFRDQGLSSTPIPLGENELKVNPAMNDTQRMSNNLFYNLHFKKWCVRLPDVISRIYSHNKGIWALQHCSYFVGTRKDSMV